MCITRGVLASSLKGITISWLLIFTLVVLPPLLVGLKSCDDLYDPRIATKLLTRNVAPLPLLNSIRTISSVFQLSENFFLRKQVKRFWENFWALGEHSFLWGRWNSMRNHKITLKCKELRSFDDCDRCWSPPLWRPFTTLVREAEAAANSDDLAIVYRGEAFRWNTTVTNK